MGLSRERERGEKSVPTLYVDSVLCVLFEIFLIFLMFLRWSFSFLEIAGLRRQEWKTRFEERSERKCSRCVRLDDTVVT